MNGLRIGEVAEILGLSQDTLRYYEKIGLLKRITRTPSGVRMYNEKDISRLKFIQRAQKMNFTLTEIGALLKMREDPHGARVNVRELTARKLREVEDRIGDLEVLRNELQLLLNLCHASKDGCPIISGIDEAGET